MLVKIVGATQIEACAVVAINRVGRLMEYFSAQRQLLRDFAL